MKNISPETLADTLFKAFNEEMMRPFPYSGARKLRHDDGGIYEGLIPDLDLFASQIAGYCSWGKGILKWSEEKVDEAERTIGKSFFDKHPKYKPLEPLITEENTPDLHAWLTLQERIRSRLLELFALLRSDAASPTKS